ncbi:MAG TPA: hypothetical protein VFK61_08920 [Candidatus Limnocylindria bacterium]|nr:hypothetical protein [Candidatus Limnocylindria bacterium]
MEAPYEGASAKAIDQLVKELRPVVEGAEGLSLEAVLDLPEAKQLIAAWAVKNDVAALARGGKVASWLVGAMRRRMEDQG